MGEGEGLNRGFIGFIGLVGFRGRLPDNFSVFCMLLQNKYQAITERVIGCAMEVHRTLGSGFQEVIYQRSLTVEMEKAGLVFGREVEMPLFYKGVDVGSRRVDFLVSDAVLVELKTLHEITPTHHAQIINYLEAYQLEVGLLINFGERSLRFKRFIKAPRPSRPNA